MKNILVFFCLVALSSCGLIHKRQQHKLVSEDAVDQISKSFFISGEDLVLSATLKPRVSKKALFRLETVDGQKVCDSRELTIDLEEGKLTPISLAVKQGDCRDYRFLVEPLAFDAQTEIKNKPTEQLGLTAVSFRPSFVSCKGLECYSQINLVAELAGEPSKNYRKVIFKLTGWVKGRENPVLTETFATKVALNETGKAKLERSFSVPVDVSIFDFEGELEISEVLD